jgi:hypothetical protein
LTAARLGNWTEEAVQPSGDIYFYTKRKYFGGNKINLKVVKFNECTVIEIFNSLFRRALTDWFLNLRCDGISVKKVLILKMIYMNFFLEILKKIRRFGPPPMLHCSWKQ